LLRDEADKSRGAAVALLKSLARGGINSDLDLPSSEAEAAISWLVVHLFKIEHYLRLIAAGETGKDPG
jgi:hypothetical protein